MSTFHLGGGEDAPKETVTFVADPSHLDRFLARVSVKKGNDHSVLPFTGEHMKRVLDFEQVPDPPTRTVMFCEDGGNDGLSFRIRHMVLRGGFLFYFDVQDVEEDEGEYDYLDAPLGVVPLDQVGVEFPPGGRRVFREHAHTDARNGYELVIYHAPDDADNEETRPPTFLVLESLGQREKWAQALRARAEINKETKLRVVFETNRSKDAALAKSLLPSRPQQRGMVRQSAAFMVKPADKNAKRGQPLEMESDDLDASRATEEFGVLDFSAEDWVDQFFVSNNDFDAPTKCRKMEQWQASIKRGLKGAVLEQYEYFVDASSEMTKMGREVAALKTMVETQNECIKEMKEIDFSRGFGDVMGDDVYDSDDDGLEPPHLRAGGRRGRRRLAPQDDDQSDESSLSSGGEGSARNLGKAGKTPFAPFDSERLIEIPAWLDDICEEISAFIKESRYTDATDLILKAKAEVSEILAMVR